MILDCDFDFEESEATQLDLKWYFNGSPVPIYQWVPSLDLGPQVIDPMFKDNLDLKYQAHSEKLKRHKALHILNPDERFSGSYKCKVSSFIDEASAENEVIVYGEKLHLKRKLSTLKVTILQCHLIMLN